MFHWRIALARHVQQALCLGADMGGQAYLGKLGLLNSWASDTA